MFRRTLFALPILLLPAALSLPTGSFARSWYVAADGSGDAPTIQAAFDSSSAGDDILVGPGTYHEGDILAKRLVFLHSEAGASHTVIDAAGLVYGVYGLESGAPWMEGFRIVGSVNAGISVRGGGAQSIRECAVYGCGAGVYTRDFFGILANITAAGGVADPHSGSGFSFSHSEPIVHNCISAFNDGYGFVEWAGGWAPKAFSCCCVFANGGPDFWGMASPLGTDGNIRADPLFCDLAAVDLHLQESSPCLPYTPPNPSCQLIGGLPIGCWQRIAEGPDADPLNLLVVEPSILMPTTPAARILLQGGGGLEGADCLWIHDSAGRVVAALLGKRRADGSLVAHWDGRGADGRRLPAGIYYAAGRTPWPGASGRVILLR